MLSATACRHLGSSGLVNSRDAKKKTNQTTWPQSASELYRPRNSRLSTKLVPTFVEIRCRVVRVTDPYGRISFFFLDRSRYLLFEVWTSSQTYYFSENVVEPRIESGTSGSESGNSEN
jgi:hypothetical protein